MVDVNALLAEFGREFVREIWKTGVSKRSRVEFSLDTYVQGCCELCATDVGSVTVTVGNRYRSVERYDLEEFLLRLASFVADKVAEK